MDTFRERPLPGSYLPVIAPTFDIFGSERLPETQNFTVVGALGGIEVTDGPVPEDKWRFVISMFGLHTDAVSQLLAPIRVVPSGGTFPQAPFESDRSVPGFFQLSTRMFACPPNSFYGFKSTAMGAFAQLAIGGLFIDFDIGEYPTFGAQS